MVLFGLSARGSTLLGFGTLPGSGTLLLCRYNDRRQEAQPDRDQ